MTVERISQLTPRQNVDNGQPIVPAQDAQEHTAQTIARGRIAREYLGVLRDSPQWRSINERNRQLILEALDGSETLAFDEGEPRNNLPQLRIDTAVQQVRQALRTQQSLIDEKPESITPINRPETNNGNRAEQKPVPIRPGIMVTEDIPETQDRSRNGRGPGEKMKKTNEENLEGKDNQELFSLIHEARLARTTLSGVVRTQGFRRLNPEDRMRALQTLQESQVLRGYVLLPTKKVRGGSTREAVGQIEFGQNAQRELTKRLTALAMARFEEQYSDQANLFKEPIALAVKQTLIEAKNSNSLETLLNQHLQITAQNAVAQAEAIIRQNQETAIISQYKNLVRGIVNSLLSRLRGAGIDYEDAVQEGNLMLLEVHKSYDSSKGGFLPYAYTKVFGKLMDLAREALPTTRSEQRNIKSVETFETSFATEYGRWPTLEELMAATNLTAKAVLRAKNAPSVISADKMEAKDYRNILSTIADEDPLGSPEEAILLKENIEEENQRHKVLRDALAHLDERSRKLIIMVDIREMPLWRAGKELGISESRVSQLLRRANARIQEFVQNPELASTDTRFMQPKPLGQFLGALGIPYWVFNQHNLGKGLHLRRGERRRIILTPRQQLAIKERYNQLIEVRRRKNHQKTWEDEARPLTSKQSQEIKRILQSIPGLGEMTVEEFMIASKTGDEKVKDAIVAALNPLTAGERETIILRLSLVSREAIAKRLRTTALDVKVMEETALEDIKTRRGIVKFPSGEVIKIRRP